MGKLGGREMTAASDLDLIVIYDFEARAQQSDGLKPLPATQYYTRLTQRLISALASQTAEGNLYEVDMRLRPSGQKGPVATQLSASSTTSSARPGPGSIWRSPAPASISGPPALRAAVEQAIRHVLTLPRDRAKIAADVRDMRARIEKEKGTRDIWDLKQVRGGLVDLEFIAQYLQLVHAAGHPEILSPNTVAALGNLSRAGLLPAGGGRHAAAGRAPVPQPHPGPAPVPGWPICAGKGAGRPQSPAGPGRRGPRFCPPGGGSGGPAGRSRGAFRRIDRIACGDGKGSAPSFKEALTSPLCSKPELNE